MHLPKLIGEARANKLSAEAERQQNQIEKQTRFLPLLQENLAATFKVRKYGAEKELIIYYSHRAG